MNEKKFNSKQIPFFKKTYYAIALDPIHIGTGGYRLGRVDNTIVREPGTNLPIIPGSSLSGPCRAFTALAVQSQDPKQNKYQKPREGSSEEYDSCAGKGGKEGDSHCGKSDCPVCTTYGFSKKNNSFQGLAQFFEARILFFPVHSILGPVWITSPLALKDYCNQDISIPKKFCRKIILSRNPTATTTADLDKNQSISKTASSPNEAELNVLANRQNFGWLLLDRETDFTKITQDNFPKLHESITDHLFLVSDQVFSEIVNDNLDVRTSVSINPFTGAAESGALFTYEAIPRTTIFWFDVIFNKPEYFLIDGNPIKTGKGDGLGWEWIKKNVETGMCLFKALGIGGMNTRGMGRFKILNLDGNEG